MALLLLHVRCVLDCANTPGRPCGGRATAWDPRFSSAEECCAAMPWKSFAECAATASPVSASPTPPLPTASPSTSAPTSAQPTSSPTSKPTVDCSGTLHWHLFRNGPVSVCVNNSNYSDETLDQSMKFYVQFDSARECCDIHFAGDNCQVIDLCAVWYANYSQGWHDGVCVFGSKGEVPKGHRTYEDQRECCSEGFFGQSSLSCQNNLNLRLR